MTRGVDGPWSCHYPPYVVYILYIEYYLALVDGDRRANEVVWMTQVDQLSASNVVREYLSGGT